MDTETDLWKRLHFSICQLSLVVIFHVFQLQVMFRGHLLTTYIKDCTSVGCCLSLIFFLLSVHIHSFASYILFPPLCRLIQPCVIKVDPSAAALQTCVSLLINFRMKQRQGQLKNTYSRRFQSLNVDSSGPLISSVQYAIAQSVMQYLHMNRYSGFPVLQAYFLKLRTLNLFCSYF